MFHLVDKIAVVIALLTGRISVASVSGSPRGSCPNYGELTTRSTTTTKTEKNKKDEIRIFSDPIIQNPLWWQLRTGHLNLSPPAGRRL